MESEIDLVPRGLALSNGKCDHYNRLHYNFLLWLGELSGKNCTWTKNECGIQAKSFLSGKYCWADNRTATWYRLSTCDKTILGCNRQTYINGVSLQTHISSWKKYTDFILMARDFPKHNKYMICKSIATHKQWHLYGLELLSTTCMFRWPTF